MSECQMPSLEAFEECLSARSLHLKLLRNVRAPNAFTCSVLGMSERHVPSLEAFEECQSAKCLHLKRLRN
eukprot:5790522-Amphidinium_carterae.1